MVGSLHKNLNPLFHLSLHNGEKRIIMIKLAILWHNHQPYYKNFADGSYLLPWVRLHAIKDYWGMAYILREFPQIRQNFNLVPSLLDQLQDYATGQAK
ncbi:hypothetical protein L0244_03045, partial [bacterium]|nr:hypothetical protein [bacterium]